MPEIRQVKNDSPSYMLLINDFGTVQESFFLESMDIDGNGILPCSCPPDIQVL